MKRTGFLGVLPPLLTVAAAGTSVLCFDGVGASTQVQSTAVRLNSLKSEHRHDNRTPANSPMAAEEESDVATTREGSARPSAYRRPSTSGSRTGSMLSTAALLGLLSAGISALLPLGSASQGHQSKDQLGSAIAPVAGLPTKALNKLVVGAVMLALVASAFAAPQFPAFLGKGRARPPISEKTREKYRDLVHEHIVRNDGEVPRLTKFKQFLEGREVKDEEFSGMIRLWKKEYGRRVEPTSVRITINGQERKLTFPEVVRNALKDKGMLESVMQRMERTPRLVSSGNKFRLEWGRDESGVRESFSLSLSENLDVAVYLPSFAEDCFWDGGERNEAGREWERALRRFFDAAEPAIPAGHVVEEGSYWSPPVRRIAGNDGETTWVIGSGWKHPQGQTEYKDGQSFVTFDVDEKVKVKMFLTRENEDLWRWKARLTDLLDTLTVKPALARGLEDGHWGIYTDASLWGVTGKYGHYDVYAPVTKRVIYPDESTQGAVKDFEALLEKTIRVFEDLSTAKPH